MQHARKQREGGRRREDADQHEHVAHVFVLFCFVLFCFVCFFCFVFVLFFFFCLIPKPQREGKKKKRKRRKGNEEKEKRCQREAPVGIMQRPEPDMVALSTRRRAGWHEWNVSEGVLGCPLEAAKGKAPEKEECCESRRRRRASAELQSFPSYRYGTFTRCFRFQCTGIFFQYQCYCYYFFLWLATSVQSICGDFFDGREISDFDANV